MGKTNRTNLVSEFERKERMKKNRVSLCKRMRVVERVTDRGEGRRVKKH
jgi:hypothetical protein